MSAFCAVNLYSLWSVNVASSYWGAQSGQTGQLDSQFSGPVTRPHTTAVNRIIPQYIAETDVTYVLRGRISQK
jgi:hypothetical protein